MENHHFLWENPLFQWPFSIAILTLPEGKLHIFVVIFVEGKK
jgi:hypothetical protein